MMEKKEKKEKRWTKVRVMIRDATGEMVDLGPLEPSDTPKLTQTIRERPNRRALQEAQKALEEPVRWTRIPLGIWRAAREAWRVLRQEVSR